MSRKPLNSQASPTDLMRVAGVEPPSPAIAAILDAAYGKQPTRAQRALWPSLSRMPWPSRTAPILVGCVGRRGLKSSGIVAWSAVHEALCGQHEQHALAGSRVYFVIVCPELRQARETTRFVEAALDSLATIGVRYSRKDPSGCVELAITAPNAQCERVIAIFTADAVALRNYAIAGLWYDEAGWLPSEDHLTVRDVDIDAAARGAMVQFPRARIFMTSTPGPAHGMFFDAVLTPPDGALVVRCASWTANPRVTEQACRRMARSPRHFDQEFAAARFGCLDEGFVDEDAVRRCVDKTGTSLGPRDGSFCIGLDVGLVHDATAIAVCSVHFVDLRGSAPIQHVTVEHLEQHRGTPGSPLSLAKVLDRVAGLSRAWRGAPVVHDSHEGSETDRGLRERGVCSSTVGMNPRVQTMRWELLGNLIHGRRLHLPPDNDLVRQLAGLRVTQLSGGQLRVEGRRDDLADAVALAVERAIRLAPTGGAIRFEWAPVRFEVGGDVGQRELTGGGRRWYRELPNGKRDYLVEPPIGTREWLQHVRRCEAEGIITPAIEAWKQAEDSERDSLTMTVEVEQE